MKEIGLILLAAGQGKRMNSSVPKVLHAVGGRPLFLHVLAAAHRLKPHPVAIVIGKLGANGARATVPKRVGMFNELGH